MPKRSPKETLKAAKNAVQKQRERSSSQKLQSPSHFHPPKNQPEYDEEGHDREPELPKVVNGKMTDDDDSKDMGQPSGEITY